MQEGRGSERPKIAPKPIIASKPKYVPPVKLQERPIHENTNVPRKSVSEQRPLSQRELPKIREFPKIAQSEKKIVTSEKQQYPDETKHQIGIATNVKYDEYSSSYVSEKCDKYISSYDSNKQNIKQFHQKAPHSPSTVCCSILSNASTDCCGMINVNKKDLGTKSITKIDSLDSNSSDSGGFKDFVQLDLTKTLSPEKEDDLISHHQRKSSLSDFVTPEVRYTTVPHIKTAVANAQALAPFLPQTEQKILQHKHQQALNRQDSEFCHKFSNFKAPYQKTEESKPKPSKLTHSQFHESTKKIEELLSQRLEREKMIKKGQSCVVDGEFNQDVEQKMMIQKQLQQKLQADLHQTVKQIQEIQSIELRMPQNQKWPEVSVFVKEIFSCHVHPTLHLLIKMLTSEETCCNILIFPKRIDITLTDQRPLRNKTVNKVMEKMVNHLLQNDFFYYIISIIIQIQFICF